MSAIKKKHFSWAGNQEKKVPSYTLQQYRVSHIKTLGGTCGQLCCFHPILVTWFLVVFGDGVTKILCDTLFIFHFVLPILPCKQKALYRKLRN